MRSPKMFTVFVAVAILPIVDTMAQQQQQIPFLGKYTFTFQLDKTSKLPRAYSEDQDLNPDPFALLEQENCYLDREENGSLSLLIPIESGSGDVVSDIHLAGASLNFNFNMWAVPPIKCSGRFDGKSNAQGTGRTADGAVTARFKLTRDGPLNTSQQSTAAQGDSAAPVRSTRTKVDLSTPEMAGKELLQAFLQSDPNRLWACASTGFRRELTDQLGGTEGEAIEELGGMFEGNPAPVAGTILRIQMQGEDHCTIQFKWTLRDKTDPQLSLPMQLIKEKGEWRLLKMR